MLPSPFAATVSVLFVVACSGGSDEARPTQVGDSGLDRTVSASTTPSGCVSAKADSSALVRVWLSAKLSPAVV